MIIRKIISFKRFGFLLQQLVKRDFKIKYRGSFLGILWSILNPLFNMIILSIVFSNVFRAVDNYKLYLLSGLLVFNYFSEASSSATHAISGNFGLITKVYFPKFILPLSKVFSSAINLLITLLVFLILGLFMGIKIWWGLPMITVMIICLVLFAAGVSLILSTLQVFFRDTAHLYSVIITIWMYSTPILYPIDIIPDAFIPIFKLNPLFIFIDFLRKIALEGVMPGLESYIMCMIFGIGTFVIGAYIFVKNQDKFIFYS